MRFEVGLVIAFGISQIFATKGKTMKLINVATTLVLLGGGLVACSSLPNKVNIPATANPSDEITSLTNDLKSAEQNQISVLGPTNYEKARELLSDAKNLLEKKKPNQEILEKLGYARSYLNLAQENVARAEQSIPEVISARRDALVSGAGTLLPKELAKIDDDLKDHMETAEKGKVVKISSKDKDALHTAYLDLELKGIKASYLGSAKSTLEAAAKEGAEKISPKTYKEAFDKIVAAERVIETDRHNKDTITSAANDATASARKLMSVNAIAKSSKSQSAEDVALEINAKNNALANTSAALTTTAADAAAKDRALKATTASLVKAKTQAAEKAEFEQIFTEAKQTFKPTEAEVLRDGSNMIIRLKALQFKSGQASLSESSFDLLSRVKGLIQQSHAEQVVVEGHTDSVGAKDVNQKISQARAETVSSYFVNDGVISKDQIQSKGYGFEKPIASNKTKEGRAENRRVDVIITPASISK